MQERKSCLQNLVTSQLHQYGYVLLLVPKDITDYFGLVYAVEVVT